jgi:23S rRNA (guanine745-N1)-methyltransferase
VIWVCPICRQPLFEREGGVACAANHQFDRAKQGYLPLLPAHHRRSASPGDDKAMLEGRRRFLQAGFYQPLADLLAEKVVQLAGALNPLTLLDSGCGEGYYLGKIIAEAQSSETGMQPYGFDISKDAAKLSAKSVPEASIAVASSFQLPIVDLSVDVLLRVFSPGSVEEVARVLKAEGEFWRVVPGPRHLFELKQALYDDVRLHELPESPEGFVLLESLPLSFVMSLTSAESIEQLLQMTPFVWHGSEQGKAQLRKSHELNVTADFVLQRYRKVAVE